jgi:2,4-dienoyl-CoA reductase-like NADH-dependent reductase (Old Yellow Enzyme family)
VEGRKLLSVVPAEAGTHIPKAAVYGTMGPRNGVPATQASPGAPRGDDNYLNAMNILLTPARIGVVEIPNRIVMPPMTTRTADEEGYVTDDTVAYYLARARGGVGLITVEMASPEKAGRHRRREVGIYDDRFLPGLTRLVAEIHRAGSKTSIQLGHGGGHTRIDICGETPIAPSAIPHPVFETTFEPSFPRK